MKPKGIKFSSRSRLQSNLRHPFVFLYIFIDERFKAIASKWSEKFFKFHIGISPTLESRNLELEAKIETYNLIYDFLWKIMHLAIVFIILSFINHKLGDGLKSNLSGVLTASSVLTFLINPILSKVQSRISFVLIMEHGYYYNDLSWREKIFDLLTIVLNKSFIIILIVSILCCTINW